MTIQTLAEMIEATERELAIKQAERRSAIERAQGLLDPVRSESKHLGHHLADVAQTIAETDAKIEQTEKVLRMLLATQEAGGFKDGSK